MAKSLFDKQSESIMAAAKFQADAIRQAAAVQAQIAKESIAFQKEQNEIARNTLAPFVEAGQSGMDQLQNLLGLKGFEAEQEAVDAVLQSPTVQKSIEQGQQALERSAAARGGLQTGRFATELQQFAQDRSLGAIQQRIGNLQQLGASGVGAAGGSANLAQMLGQNVAQTMGQNADAQSSLLLQLGQVQASSTLATSPAAQLAFNLSNAQGSAGGLMQAGGLGGGAFGFLGGSAGRSGGFF